MTHPQELDTVTAVQRGRDLAEAEARGEDPTGAWTDVTDRVLSEADRIRARGAA
ncbi:hypothetical protein ABZV31_35535 [Streptomyces sp. NPDC005202]|uniref:hypothetical protein n=1 Tax=Streptomyces sp. NPDC005202 TaxID=3157021 RepID=UPI0033BF29FF